MDFTNPFTATGRKQLQGEALAQAIRMDMAAEMDAINLYVAHLEGTEDPVIRGMIEHIIAEEKEHLAEFEQILLMLDATQREKQREAAIEMQERRKAA